MGDTVQVTESVDADPLAVYELVSDVTQMGRWSPETTSCRWLDGATGPAIGARFAGANRRGLLRWSTRCTVTAADPGRRFAFTVSYGPLSIADWSYDFRAEAVGAVVTESWVDRRSLPLRVASPLAMGIVDRATHNRTGMAATLAALKAAAEAAR